MFSHKTSFFTAYLVLKGSAKVAPTMGIHGKSSHRRPGIIFHSYHLMNGWRRKKKVNMKAHTILLHLEELGSADY
jgi:hypothetical protein